MITHARVKFRCDSTLQILLVKSIKYSEDDEKSIQPQNEMDFEKTHLYWGLWSSCRMGCNEEHDHYDYYECTIVLLGG